MNDGKTNKKKIDTLHTNRHLITCAFKPQAIQAIQAIIVSVGYG